VILQCFFAKFAKFNGRANGQFAQGWCVYELSLTSKPNPRKSLTSEGLSAASEFALSGEIKYLLAGEPCLRH
jgi:hypothetical protein